MLFLLFVLHVVHGTCACFIMVVLYAHLPTLLPKCSGHESHNILSPPGHFLITMLGNLLINVHFNLTTVNKNNITKLYVNCFGGSSES